MNFQRLSPAALLATALVPALLVVGTVLSQAMAPRWLGLQLAWNEQAHVALVVRSEGPGAAIEPGTALVAIESDAPDSRIGLQKQDFAAEPATDLRTFADYDAFLQRQGRIAALQSSGRPVFVDAAGGRHAVDAPRGRPVASLPAEFWVQVIVGLVAWTISAGVFCFRRNEASARYLLLSGFSTLLFAPLAAVYSTRELALAENAFRWLCDFNFFGGALYGATMVALLWYYPRRLGRFPAGPVLVAIYVLWWVAQELRLVETMIWGRRSLVLAGLVATCVLGAVQWSATRRDPVARASLQWFLLSWLVGVGLFSALIFVPQAFGVSTASLQGYGFLLFLLVYGGLAFGILRFRLFDLGEWWFRVLLWIGAAALFVALDLALVLLLGLNTSLSSSLALLTCGFLWLPLRGWLWARLVETPRPVGRALFDRVIDVSLAPSAAERDRRGRALLQSMFDPLQIETAEPVARAELLLDGLVMQLPANGQTPPLVLRYPGGGRRLFTSRDLQAAVDMLDMLRHADTSRDAYAQGAREERGRIARDLHDDIGARLLTGLDQDDIGDVRQTMRHALADMRTIIGGLTGERLPLAALVAELRHETAERVEARGLLLDWPLPADESGAGPAHWVDYRAARHCASALRELVSNALRHARASRIAVRLDADAGGLLRLEVADDGTGLPADATEAGGGHGQGNLRQRAAEAGGSLEVDSGPAGTTVRMLLPGGAPA